MDAITQRGRAGRSSYFSIVGAVMLALTLIGFSDNLLTNVDQPSNHDPKFIVHGLFCLAWVALFAVQAMLARSRNIRLHRTLGMAGMAVAAGVALSTLYVFVAVWKGWDAMQVVGKANRVLLPGFALFALLGFLNRKRPDRHKRLLTVATFYMLEPVLSRAFDPFIPLEPSISEEQIDQLWWIFFTVTWNGLFLSLLLHDWRTLGRIHGVSAAGYAGFCMLWSVIWFL